MDGRADLGVGCGDDDACHMAVTFFHTGWRKRERGRGGRERIIMKEKGRERTDGMAPLFLMQRHEQP